jgi:hypothetical protein
LDPAATAVQQGSSERETSRFYHPGAGVPGKGKLKAIEDAPAQQQMARLSDSCAAVDRRCRRKPVQ